MDTSDAAKRAGLIRRASVIALAGNLLLAAAKLVLGTLSRSLAVTGDGIDSLADVLTSLMAIFVSGIIAKPGDTEHPWGHGRAETIASLVLSLAIAFAGARIVLGSAQRLLGRTASQGVTTAAIWAAAASIAGKLALAATQRHYARATRSPLLEANAANMRGDILLSAGVLVGVTLSRALQRPYLDPAVAALVGLWVIKEAACIFMDVNRELMDGNADPALYQSVFEAAQGVDGVTNPHRARIRKIAAQYVVELDIEVNPALSVFDAHEKAEQVEEAIRRRIPQVYDVVIHIEPEGSDTHQRAECYGLSPGTLG